MKNSNDIMNEFLLLDKNERIPLMLSIQLLLNKKCRTQVRLLTKAEKLAAEPLKIQIPASDSSIEAVLSKINQNHTEKSPISLCRWIVSGLLMIFLMLIFGIITKSDSSQALMISFYLLFATLVTAYCALFVGCNLDFFIKKIETINLAV